MNKAQKVVLSVVAVVILVAGPFPPVHASAAGAATANYGYSSLFAAPNPYTRGHGCPTAVTVDVPMLLTEWLGILPVGGLVFCVLGDRKRPSA
jgi:hypothetical protein